MLLAALAASCVTRDEGAAPRHAAKVRIDGGRSAPMPTLDSTACRSVFARVLASGGAKAVERAVAARPDQALVVARHPPDDELRREVAGAYDRALAPGGSREAVEAALSTEGEGRAAALEEARDRAAAAGAGHLAFDAAVALVRERRTSGDMEAAARVWREAVAAGRGIDDPTLWRALVELRPPVAAWPDDAPPRTEAEAYALLAACELRRGDAGAAAVDALKAESGAADDPARKRARLLRAQALYGQRRHGEALALLPELVQHDDPEVVRPAWALGGVVAAELGDLERARELLRRAADGAGGWAGLARVQADLAITDLRLGRRDEGLAGLRAAAGLFEQAGDYEGLVATLGNEARFLRHSGDEQSAGVLEHRVAELAREHGIVLAN